MTFWVTYALVLIINYLMLRWILVKSNADQKQKFNALKLLLLTLVPYLNFAVTAMLIGIILMYLFEDVVDFFKTVTDKIFFIKRDK